MGICRIQRGRRGVLPGRNRGQRCAAGRVAAVGPCCLASATERYRRWGSSGSIQRWSAAPQLQTACMGGAVLCQPAASGLRCCAVRTRAMFALLVRVNAQRVSRARLSTQPGRLVLVRNSSTCRSSWLNVRSSCLPTMACRARQHRTSRAVALRSSRPREGLLYRRHDGGLSPFECLLQVMSTQTLRSHKHPLISEDHMFAAFVDSGLVTDLACFYDREQQRFTSVIALGPRTCGYKRITHGGKDQLIRQKSTCCAAVRDVHGKAHPLATGRSGCLVLVPAHHRDHTHSWTLPMPRLPGMTAAIIDESFGGLLLALRQAGALPFWGPAFTASLEVAYKAVRSSSRAGSVTLSQSKRFRPD